MTHLFDPSVRIELSRLVPRPKMKRDRGDKVRKTVEKRQKSQKDQHERTEMARMGWNRTMSHRMTMVIYSFAVQYSIVQHDMLPGSVM